MKKDELVMMKAIALCFKPYLKPEEAMIYCNLERTQFARKCQEFGIYKNNNGYFKREELDQYLSGQPSQIEAAVKNLKLKEIR